MPPNEPCPHCGRLIGDWHNEWDEGAQRVAIYRGQPTTDGPPCRQAVLWFESRDLTAPPADAPVAVYPRSVLIAAHWVPVREPTSTNRADYLAHHPTDLYIVINDAPKLDHLRQQFPQLYRQR